MAEMDRIIPRSIDTALERYRHTRDKWDQINDIGRGKDMTETTKTAEPTIEDQIAELEDTMLKIDAALKAASIRGIKSSTDPDMYKYLRAKWAEHNKSLPLASRVRNINIRAKDYEEHLQDFVSRQPERGSRFVDQAVVVGDDAGSDNEEYMGGGEDSPVANEVSEVVSELAELRGQIKVLNRYMSRIATVMEETR